MSVLSEHELSSESLLEVEDLTVAYGRASEAVRAVVNVDLVVNRGEFIAIVGESGCGKSTLCFAIAQLLPPSAHIEEGEVRFKGANLVTLRKADLRHLRWREFAVVMQSAMNALNPILTVGEQFRDAIAAQERISRSEARDRAAEALKIVGVDPMHVRSYPHQLSGGMRQRAMVAMALIFRPDLLIMDEPTSALDVVGQRALMREIKDLQRQFGFAVIFVTHDVSVVARFSDRVAVMYAGEIVELVDTKRLFDARHPYTRGLLDSFPSIAHRGTRLEGIPGNPPNLRTPPSGCRFHPRCPSAMPNCLHDVPEVLRIGSEFVRCHLYDKSASPSR